MTNGKTNGEGNSAAPVETSRADRVMGRIPTATKSKSKPDTPPRGRTTQSWRPPTAKNGNAGSSGSGTAHQAQGNGSNGRRAEDTSGQQRAPQGSGARDTVANNPAVNGDERAGSTAVATGSAAAAVPGAGSANARTTTSAPTARHSVAEEADRPVERRSGGSAKPPVSGTTGNTPGPVRPRTGTTASSASSASQFGAARRTRKARLRLARLDPWSVMKTAFLFSIAAMIVFVIAVAGIYGVVQTAGLFDAINGILRPVVSVQNDPSSAFDIASILSLERVLGGAFVIGALNVVILTALATLFSFLYNISATVLGGLEVTLAED